MTFDHISIYGTHPVAKAAVGFFNFHNNFLIKKYGGIENCEGKWHKERAEFLADFGVHYTFVDDCKYEFTIDFNSPEDETAFILKWN
jgi:hypothetical protein